VTINDLRVKTGLSQAGFSKKYGIPVRTVQQWEQGRSTPPDYLTCLLEKEILGQCRANNNYIDKLKLRNQKNWRMVPGVSFKNANKVHPLQQKKVALVLSEIKYNKDVKKVYVFGSSVNNSCHVGSDLDLYFEMNEDKSPIKNTYPFEVDVLNNFNVDQGLMDEIKKKGVVVYG